MSRAIDDNKIEAIRLAAIEVVSQMGIEKSSVAIIAQRAGVSTGYLYRFYPSKAELIRELVEQILDTIVNHIEQECKTTADAIQIVASTVRYIVMSDYMDQAKHKFLFMLYADFSHQLGEHIRAKIEQTAQMLISKGREQGAISDKITIEDMFVAIMGLPMQYIATRHRLSLDNGAIETQAWLEHIVQASTAIIKR